MSNIVYIFKPSDITRYSNHFDPVQGFVGEVVMRNQKLFEEQLRFFAYFASPQHNKTDYDRAGLIYKRIGDDDPLKHRTQFELFRKINEMAKKLGAPPPRNPSTDPALEVVGPTKEQYRQILDFALSETFYDLGAKLPEEVKRFAALMCSNKTLDDIVIPHLDKRGFNVEVVRN